MSTESDTSPDTVLTLDRCAQIAAQLDDPYADRAAVLRDAGLDEARWAAAQEHWSAKLAGPDCTDLKARYSALYEATLRRIARGRDSVPLAGKEDTLPVPEPPPAPPRVTMGKPSPGDFEWGDDAPPDTKPSNGPNGRGRETGRD